MNSIPITTGRPYFVTGDTGVPDLWWPYGPATGRYSMKVCGEHSGGRLTQLLISDSRGAATPLHRHLDVDETFYIVSGEVTIVVGDEQLVARAGDFVFGPMGVPHAYAVTSEEAEMFVTCAGSGQRGPSGHGIDGFFRDVASPVVAGEPAPPPCVPDSAEFARMMAEYGIELLGPPPAIV